MDENKLGSTALSDNAQDIESEAVPSDAVGFEDRVTATTDESAASADVSELLALFDGFDEPVETAAEESITTYDDNKSCDIPTESASRTFVENKYAEDSAEAERESLAITESEEGAAPRSSKKSVKNDISIDEEPKRRRDGLGYAIIGGVLFLICGVMLAFLISSFCSASDLIASISPDRGFVGISVIVAIMVTIISAVGCIMASLALLYISSLALSRSEGVFTYIAVAQMSASVIFILASIILSVVVISMA